MRFNPISSVLGGLAALLLAPSVVVAQWQINSLTSIGDTSNNSTTFSISRGSQSTSCAVSWGNSGAPTVWTKCSDPNLRFLIETYENAGSFLLQIVQVNVDNSTAPPTVGVTQTTFSFDPTNNVCTTTSTSQECTLSPAPESLTPTSSTLTPQPLSIYYTLLRDDGSPAVQTPCSEAYTFYIVDPSVTTLGPITLGRWNDDDQWRTICTSNWACGGTDPSINTWSPCAAPAFQFKKTLPSSGGDQLSNFILSITHTFPLMMATSIRGSDAPDLTDSDTMEAGGLQVVLTGQNTVWQLGSTLSSIQQGGVDQTGNCATGCEFSGVSTSVNIVDVEII
ncbi:hypothetical protein G7Y89_g11660 [Cudoniella acicularis]|uniref:Uncharacterized protein n=1 Tax=Cudoniella acicularis TaxID=354080 RepID=A0A8H4RBK7_9HELO|nr:hypothetical protein G7Y89_g11660 [Cudoniella acicularis]